MSHFDMHVWHSKLIFGKGYEEVHLWLDEFAGKPPYGMRHRRVRHHKAGIREAIKLFGEDAGPVARKHIESDLKNDEWTEFDRFPRDEEDYARMGLF